MYEWLVSHPWFGSYIQSFREYNAVTLKTKIIAIALLWLAIGNVVYFLLQNEFARVLLLLAASGATIYLLSLKTLTEEMKREAARKHRGRRGAYKRR